MPRVIGIGLLLLLLGGASACGESFAGAQSAPPAGGTSADGGGSGGSAGRGGGGSSSGGTAGSTGGGANGGTSAGGSAGGVGATGGTSGGSSTGGTAAGGNSTGGTAAGGSSTGGSSTGGSFTGGSSTGGSVGTAGAGGTIDAGPIMCIVATQCPKPASACRLAACLQNVCSSIPLAQGVSPQQTRGDCLRLTCTSDGGEQITADPTDADDGNECTTDACNGTVATHVPRTGSTCTGGYCNTQSSCVRCLDASHCGTPAACMKYECVSGNCQLGPAPAGTLCNNSADQCNGAGVCVDCVNNGGCGECCVCTSMNTCIMPP
jgi:hypothetical protein